MSDLPAFVQLGIFGIPFWVLALLAVATTGRATQQGWLSRFFRNRASAYGFSYFSLAIIAIIVAMLAISIGGCTGGWYFSALECQSLPLPFGRFLNDFAFFATITTASFGLGSMVAYILAEVITRYRAR